MSKVTVITGSHRAGSESLKIGKMIQGKLGEHAGCDEVNLLELATANVPMWAESYSDGEQAVLDQVKAQLASSDAFVVISPEWHGMVPSALKNLFLLFTADVFAHKPALIVSISAGTGGAYPVTELRSTVYKNSRICFIPEHLIFRGVGSIFNGKDDDDMHNQNYMDKRTDFALDYLTQYSQALKVVRENAPDGSDFGNGM
jgi:NAD(P)H-dependent FMN reductase